MAASSVPLHPVATRDGQQTATMASFQLADGGPQQAKAQATASIAAELSGLGVSAEAGHEWSAASQEFKSATAPSGLDSLHGVLPRGASSSDHGPLSTSLPITSDEVTMFGDQAAPHSVEWGLRHSDLQEYQALPELGERQPSSSTETMGSPPSSMAFKKAASWCSAPGGSIAMRTMVSSQDGPTRAPIRLLSATQFARMHEEYLDQDVPHHVVFPFLHGVDGDNPAQNVFFGAPLGGQPTPRYRGLTIVRADMPSAEALYARYQPQRQGASAPLPLYRDGSDHDLQHGEDVYMRGEPRLEHSQSKSDSCCSSEGSDDSGRSSDDSCSVERGDHEGGNSSTMYEHVAANMSMASSNTTTMSHASGQSFFSEKIANQSSQSDTASSFSSSSPNPVHLGDKAPIATEAFGFATAQDANKAMSNDDLAYSDFCDAMLARAHEPQPPHSILNSTLFPCELLNIPSPLVDERTRPRASTSASGPPSPSKHLYKRLSGPFSSPSSSSASNLDPGAQPRRKATFATPRQAAGVSLRNFRIQAIKYATISDIVVYSPVGLHAGAIELAKHFRDAQEEVYRERLERGLGGLRYNVFIVTDSFFSFERDFEHLVAVDSQGRQRHAVAFLDREREEMQRLTRATEIDPNVWFGCSKDVPPLEPEDQEVLSVADASNPHGFSFCIEAHEMAFMPNDETLRRASSYLDAVERMSQSQSASQHYGHGQGQDYFGFYDSTAGTPSNASSPASTCSSIIHLECASSSQHCSNVESLSRMADDIIDFCAWIKSHACPGHSTQSSDQATFDSASPQARKFLFHCGDGYTETSIMALSYLMFSRELSLPEAYLDLQHRAARSFFLYARDVPLLKRVDDKLTFLRRMARQAQEEARMRAQVTNKPKAKHSFPWLSNSNDESKAAQHGRMQSASDGLAASEHSSWAKSIAAAATGLVSPSASHQSSQHRKSLGFASTSPLARGGARGKRSSCSVMEAAPQETQDDAQRHAWFHNPRFEGSFPSRILPFLYLGNLNHAMNADMLHALGITHVVSVGESAMHPPPDAYANTADYAWESEYADPSTPCVSSFADAALWHEVQAGRISVLDLKNVSDDGIDSLRATMRESVEYIENARRAGGKVLVHCRVGVSRSATVVLAYVMAHLDLSFVEAYLLVRSRRLNILIQPHLLFFWELRGWEKFLVDQKAMRAGEATPACVPSQPSPNQCPEVEYKDVDEEMTDADVGPTADADERAFSMAALSLCSFAPALNPAVATSMGAAASGTSSPSPTLETSATPATTTTTAFDHNEGRLDVDLAAGAGSVYGRRLIAPETLPFGSGSPAGLPYKSLRLTWGFLCREIAALNERYCV